MPSADNINIKKGGGRSKRRVKEFCSVFLVQKILDFFLHYHRLVRRAHPIRDEQFLTMVQFWRRRFVVLAHGKDWKTIYGQLDTLFVKPGQNVKCGETIGLVRSTGRTTGPHLHFELHQKNKPVDPQRYISALTR